MIPTTINTTKQGREAMDIISLEYADRNIYLIGKINDENSTETIAQLRQLDKTDGDITLRINSPGGSVSAGLAILDQINLCKNDVCTVATGVAASMGAFLLSCGAKGKRHITENCDVMIHQPLGGVQGQASDIELNCNHIMYTKRKLNSILSKNTGKDIETINKDTDRDNWLSAQEAVEYGLADGVIKS